MMEKELIPYEEALALKELGFAEPCIANFYRGDKRLIPYRGYPDKGSEDTHFSTMVNMDYSDAWVTAPLYQQAFRWFREKHKLSGYVCDMYRWCIDNMFTANEYETYEEAQLACLRKLIKIVKNKKIC